jgi:hypothetical protein
VFESECSTHLIGSEYTLFLNPSLCLTYTTTNCYIHPVGRVTFQLVFEEMILPRERERVSFFTILPLPSPEKVCVVSCSLEAFLVLLFSFEVPLKKLSEKMLQQKETKKAATKNGLCVCFFPL